MAEDEEGASKAREQSVYAEPIPIPAPKAIDAHLVTGLPIQNQKLRYEKEKTISRQVKIPELGQYMIQIGEIKHSKTLFHSEIQFI